jgi:hypothetical protein
MRYYNNLTVGVLGAFLLGSVMGSSAAAQHKQKVEDQFLMPMQKIDTTSRKNVEDPDKVFKGIERAISAGNVDFLISCFGQKLFVSVERDRTGYYSANQAYYIMQEFFRSNQPVIFSLDSYSSSLTNPYAVGTFAYAGVHGRGSAQVYVSLTLVKNIWKIDQISFTKK